MSGTKYVLRTRGEATLAAALVTEGIKEDAAVARAVRIAQFLNRCGARVFHWTEIVMAMLFVAALSLVGGIFVGLSVGAK